MPNNNVDNQITYIFCLKHPSVKSMSPLKYDLDARPKSRIDGFSIWPRIWLADAASFSVLVRLWLCIILTWTCPKYNTWDSDYALHLELRMPKTKASRTDADWNKPRKRVSVKPLSEWCNTFSYHCRHLTD